MHVKIKQDNLSLFRRYFKRFCTDYDCFEISRKCHSHFSPQETEKKIAVRHAGVVCENECDTISGAGNDVVFLNTGLYGAVWHSYNKETSGRTSLKFIVKFRNISLLLFCLYFVQFVFSSDNRTFVVFFFLYVKRALKLYRNVSSSAITIFI